MQVIVVDDHKYEEFEPMNEILMKRGGVKMNPEPKFMISGLSPGDNYYMKIRIEMVDELRYMYQINQWIPVSSANKKAKLCKFGQSETRKEKGSLWNSIIVQFDKLRITRELSEVRQNVIYVEPNHKYIPILSIVNTTTGTSSDFRFDQLQFIPVKCFQSIQIRHAKRSTRNFSFLSSNILNSDRKETEKPKSLMSTELIPNNSLQNNNQMYSSIHYPYLGEIGKTKMQPYQFDYFHGFPHIQYPHHQLPYLLPFQTNQIQYPQTKQIMYQNKEELKQYVPEYGWNPILVPGAQNEREARCQFQFNNEIWTPQEMELEYLYFKTEQNYHPLEMN